MLHPRGHFSKHFLNPNKNIELGGFFDSLGTALHSLSRCCTQFFSVSRKKTVSVLMSQVQPRMARTLPRIVKSPICGRFLLAFGSL